MQTCIIYKILNIRYGTTPQVCQTIHPLYEYGINNRESK